MANGIMSLRRRGVRLALAGVASAAVAVGGVTAAGAVTGPAQAPAPAAVPAAVPAGAVGAAQVDTAATQQLKMGEYVLSFDIKKTNRYAKTVFSEVTNEGKFNQIFPIRGAKRNLGQVGTKHNLFVGPVAFPVTVAGLSSISWQFKTRLPHPDYPGRVGFAITGGGGSMMRLTVVGTCYACGTAAYKKQAKKTWTPFANNIRNKIKLP